ncbi:hypothetical protein K3495_g8589 [Podosphaera aphanis]|nr:hypothetical protein K3495_g8589 [Podosphaera aphanis]
MFGELELFFLNLKDMAAVVAQKSAEEQLDALFLVDTTMIGRMLSLDSNTFLQGCFSGVEKEMG